MKKEHDGFTWMIVSLETLNGSGGQFLELRIHFVLPSDLFILPLCDLLLQSHKASSHVTSEVLC